MRLQLSREEQQVFRQLSQMPEGMVLLRYFQRLQQHVTDTRNIDRKTHSPEQLAAIVEGANQASDILDENVIRLLSEKQEYRNAENRFD